MKLTTGKPVSRGGHAVVDAASIEAPLRPHALPSWLPVDKRCADPLGTARLTFAL